MTRGKPFIRLSIHPSRDRRARHGRSWRRSRTPSPGPGAPDAAAAMLRLLGYTDRLSAAPGDTIRFMVSSDHDRYTSRLVRLIHGDTNPAGPGFKQVLVPSAIDGDPGRPAPGPAERLVGDAPGAGGLDSGPDFTFAVFVQPTRRARREQVIASRGRPFDGDGWALVVSEPGPSRRSSGGRGTQTRIATGIVLPRWEWCFVALTVGGRRRVRSATCPGAIRARRAASPRTARRSAPGRSPTTRRARCWRRRRRRPAARGSLRRPPRSSAAHRPGPRRGGAARPRRRRPTTSTPSQPTSSAPGTSASTSRRPTITDVSGHDRHGTTDQPADPRASPATTSAATRPTGARRPASTARSTSTATTSRTPAGTSHFELTIPADLPSGDLRRLAAGRRRRGLPAVHGPPAARHQPLADRGPDVDRDVRDVRQLHRHRPRRLARGRAAPATPIGPAVRRPDDLPRRLRLHRGERRCTARTTSTRTARASATARCCEPILNMRPKFRYRTLDCPGALPGRPLPRRLARAEGHRGRLPDRPRPPSPRASTCSGRTRSSLSSSHHEYWTRRMLDALAAYLDGGGRFMYLGGNSLFGVVTRRSATGRTCVEVRRWGTAWPFEMPPASATTSMTGEQGGTWRNRGRGAARDRRARARPAPGSIAARRTGASPTATTRAPRSSSRASRTT